MAFHLKSLLTLGTAVPVLGAATLAVIAVKKGWVKNPLDKLAGTKVGQLLGSSDDLAQAQAAMQADLQRYAMYPGSAPGYSPMNYGFGWGQQAPGFGASPYPMMNPYYGQQWFAQPQNLAPSWNGVQPAGGLPQGGMVAQWHS